MLILAVTYQVLVWKNCPPNTHSPCRSLRDEIIGKAQRGFLLFISNRQAALLQDT